MSACAQVGAGINEGIWNSQKRLLKGMDIPQTRQGDAAHYRAFLLGTPSFPAAACNMQPILHLPCACFVLCILHLTMAIARWLGEFVDREVRGFSPLVREDLEVFPSVRRAGCSVYGVGSLDGQATANL